jgi:hypothetical protein
MYEDFRGAEWEGISLSLKPGWDFNSNSGDCDFGVTEGHLISDSGCQSGAIYAFPAFKHTKDYILQIRGLNHHPSRQAGSVPPGFFWGLDTESLGSSVMFELKNQGILQTLDWQPANFGGDLQQVADYPMPDNTKFTFTWKVVGNFAQMYQNDSLVSEGTIDPANPALTPAFWLGMEPVEGATPGDDTWRLEQILLGNFVANKSGVILKCLKGAVKVSQGGAARVTFTGKRMKPVRGGHLIL